MKYIMSIIGIISLGTVSFSGAMNRINDGVGVSIEQVKRWDSIATFASFIADPFRSNGAHAIVKNMLEQRFDTKNKVRSWIQAVQEMQPFFTQDKQMAHALQVTHDVAQEHAKNITYEWPIPEQLPLSDDIKTGQLSLQDSNTSTAHNKTNELEQYRMIQAYMKGSANQDSVKVHFPSTTEQEKRDLLKNFTAMSRFIRWDVKKNQKIMEDFIKQEYTSYISLGQPVDIITEYVIAHGFVEGFDKELSYSIKDLLSPEQHQELAAQKSSIEQYYNTMKPGEKERITPFMQFARQVAQDELKSRFTNTPY